MGTPTVSTIIQPKPLHLRPYQVEAQQAVRAAWESGTTGPLIVLATGTGKTVTAMGLVVEALERGERVVWLAHRDELVSQQPRNTLGMFWPEMVDRCGVVQAGDNDTDSQLIFASVQTLASRGRADQVVAHGAIDLLVCDECHRAAAPEYQKTLAKVEAKRRLGLSATPEREDGADLSETWEIVYSFGIVEAIGQGYLLPPYAAVDRVRVDLDEASEDMAVVGESLLLAGIVDHTVAALSKSHKAERLPWRDDKLILSPTGRSTLVFTATVEQAELTAAALCKAGRVARWVAGTTPKGDRRRLLAAFAAGRIDVLCNAAVLTEGTDLPPASCIVLARPTRSRVLYVQIVGRGLRLYEDQECCLVIDLSGATEVHSLVAAPVLVGETPCPKSPDRHHDFTNDEGEATCGHCGHRLPCWAALESGQAAGRHVYVDGVCKHCGRVQCPESPTNAHAWVPEVDAGVARRRCMWCDGLTRDPLGGLAKERELRKPVKAAWTLLPGLVPRVWAVDLGEVGIAFMREHPGDRYEPLWLPKRKRRARSLGAVDARLARAWVDDIVRRAEPKWDARSKEEVRGGHGQAADREDWVRRAMVRATHAGVADWQK